MRSRFLPAESPTVSRTSVLAALAVVLVVLGSIPAWCQASSGKPTISKERAAAINEKNKQLEAENELIAKYQTAQHDKNWPDAENILGQLIALNPNHWEYQKSLGDAQFNQGKYDDALATYKKTIPAAQAAPNGDPAATKSAIAQMLTWEGNSYLKLRKNEEAIAAFTKAAEMSPNPGIAYFNLCAIEYNQGHTESALAACDKAILRKRTRTLLKVQS
jgi:tetratricopeptide (TPR) repeat protein